MRTRLKAEYVIGFDGSAHELWRDGEVVFSGNAIEFVGRGFQGRVDRTIDYGRAVISPGLIDLDALGLEREIGSLETGKKADVILVDLFKAHLVPLNMPVYRVTCFANGADVSTTIVDGNVLMEDRKVQTLDEVDVMEQAQVATDRMLARTGLGRLLEAPPTLWNAAHY